jgi:hypothetical protein
VAVFGDDESAVAVIAVAVGHVAGEREREALPVGVVGVGDDELRERGEVALDGVEVAGVRRRGHELDGWLAANVRMSGVQLAERLSWIQEMRWRAG